MLASRIVSIIKSQRRYTVHRLFSSCGCGYQSGNVALIFKHFINVSFSHKGNIRCWYRINLNMCKRLYHALYKTTSLTLLSSLFPTKLHADYNQQSLLMLPAEGHRSKVKLEVTEHIKPECKSRRFHITTWGAYVIV